MSENDIFAALQLGIKFDTRRFKKDIEQFEPKQPEEEAGNQGMKRKDIVNESNANIYVLQSQTRNHIAANHTPTYHASMTSCV